MPDKSGPPPLIDPTFRHCPACGAELTAARPVRCERCGARHWRNAKPCAGALVVADGRLLLVRRAFAPFIDHWDIPGGFCDPDEHPADAAVREVREETGVDVRVTAFLGMWMDRYEQHGTVQSTLNIYFTAVPDGPATVAVDPREASDADWFAPDDLPGQIAFPDHAESVLATWRATLPDRSS